jgi:hypothetical protein
MTKRTKTSNVIIRLNAMTSNRTLFARKSISISLLNEISRTIYCAERINDTFFQNFLKENFWNKIIMIRTLIISNTKKRSICWKKNISETTWTKMLKNTSIFVRLVIESSSWNTNLTICCKLFQFQKIQDKIEQWISSQICYFRSIEISCTIRF